MDREEVKKIFSEQLQLLAERSKKSSSNQDLCALTSAMAEIMHYFPSDNFL